MTRVLAVVLLALGLLAGSQVTAPPPARADARVGIDNDGSGGARADLRYRTLLQVTGSGFQVVRNGFGGVYVMFGWVDDPRGGSWRPSRGGLTGQDYRYVPDSENTADNAGYLKFVAFPGSSTAAEAHAVLSPAGGFSLDLTVPGPVFESLDRDGTVRSVDCRRVTCGVITIGAHGVKNPANETFTPVAFGEVYAEQPGGTGGSGGTGDDATGEATGSADDPGTGTGAAAGRGTGAVPAAADAPRGRPRVTADRATAVAGHALVFTARGFGPGEQVVVTLDDGLAALTSTAGSAGEVAGTLVLPDDADGGTHELRVTGAATGREARERFPILGAAAQEATPSATDDAAAGPSRLAAHAGPVYLGTAALLLVLALAGLVRVRRRAARGSAPAAGTTGATGAAGAAGAAA